MNEKLKKRLAWLLVENTDYFVHYEAAAVDFIVTATDQSANSGWALYAY